MLASMTVEGILNDNPDKGGQEDLMIAALYVISMLAGNGNEANAKIVYQDMLSDFETFMNQFFEQNCSVH